MLIQIIILKKNLKMENLLLPGKSYGGICRINQTIVLFTIDTGCAKSVITKSVYLKIKDEDKDTKDLTPTGESFSSYTSSFTPIGVLQCSILAFDEVMYLNTYGVYVSDTSSKTDFLVGMDLINSMPCFKFLFDTMINVLRSNMRKLSPNLTFLNGFDVKKCPSDYDITRHKLVASSSSSSTLCKKRSLASDDEGIESDEDIVCKKTNKLKIADDEDVDRFLKKRKTVHFSDIIEVTKYFDSE
jgi:hypothetical protein